MILELNYVKNVMMFVKLARLQLQLVCLVMKLNKSDFFQVINAYANLVILNQTLKYVQVINIYLLINLECSNECLTCQG